jgi:hypothetical protein
MLETLKSLLVTKIVFTSVTRGQHSVSIPDTPYLFCPLAVSVQRHGPTVLYPRERAPDTR